LPNEVGEFGIAQEGRLMLLEKLCGRQLVTGSDHFEVEVTEDWIQQLGQLRFVGIVRLGDPKLKINLFS
jgi:hypothetical protein